MKHSSHDDYLDHSDDLVARVRAAKEAAQRKMEEFGDIAEYDVIIIRGHGPEEPPSENASPGPVAEQSNSASSSIPPQPTAENQSASVRETTLEFIGDLRESDTPVEED